MATRQSVTLGGGVLPATTVLEFSSGWSAAAVCGRLLAELGARVTKVEQPGGDPIHGIGPKGPSGDALATSLVLLGKGLHPLSSLDRLKETLVTMSRRSDLLLFDSWWAKHLEALGLADEASWRQVNPSLVVCSMTPFGRGNAFSTWKGSELVTQAMTGLMSINGFPGSQPLRVGFPLVTHVSAVLGCAAMLSALYRHHDSGEGEFIDFAEFDAGMMMLYNHLPGYMMTGEPPQKIGNRHGMTPFNAYPTRDGLVAICMATEPPWVELLQVMDRPDLIGDERYRTPGQRRQRYHEVDDLVAAWTCVRSSAEVVKALENTRVAAGYVKSIREVLSDPHGRQRGMVQEMRNGDARVYTNGSIFNIAGAQCNVRPAQALQSGSQTKPSVARSGATKEAGKPLAGVRILQLGQYTTIPFGCRLLADLGAEVLEVQTPEGDPLERGFRGPVGNRLSFDTNRPGKKSIFLNLSNPRGPDLLKQLLRHCDVFIQNFSMEAIERWGLTYEALRETNPRLVYVSMTGFGVGNPFTKRRAYDTVLQGEGGMMSLNGKAGDIPLKTAPSTVDIVGGMVGAAATAAALNRRAATGEGSFVDCAMYDVAVWLTTESWPIAWAGGDPGRSGNRHPFYRLHNAFQARDGRWVVVAALTKEDEEMASRLFKIPEGADANVMDSTAGRWVASLEGQEAVRQCQENGIPAALALTIPEAAEHPLTNAREMIVTLPTGANAMSRTFGAPFKTRRGPALGPQRGPVERGEDTEQVLAELLGLSEQERAALREAGVTAKSKSAAPGRGGRRV